MIDIEVDVREVRAGLARLRDAGEDLAPLMLKIAGHLHDSVEESFAQEAAPGRGPWTPLHPETIERRRAAGLWGPGPNVLQRSGDLARSVVPASDAESAVAGTASVYAATHQFGDDDRGIPARPFLALWPDQRRAILADIAAHFGLPG